MKRIALLVLLISALATGGAYADNPFGVIGGGGGSGTTNASDLTSGEVATARGGWGIDISASDGVAVFTSGSPSFKTLTQFLALMGVTFNSADNTWSFVAAITGPEFVSNAADNTHYGNVKNSASPTGTNLAAGNYWTLTDETLRLRNNDNTATNILASANKYYRVTIDAPTTADNVVIDGPIPFAQVWDNVLIIVQDTTGKLSGSASDNVTVNLSYCSSIATPTCTNVFTTDQTATGAAILTPALNNTAPSAADYIRVTVSAANMTSKKVYIRARYVER